MEYCEKELGVNFQTLKKNPSFPQKMPSVNDGEEKIESYRKGWEKLKHDFEDKNI